MFSARLPATARQTETGEAGTEEREAGRFRGWGHRRDIDARRRLQGGIPRASVRNAVCAENDGSAVVEHGGCVTVGEKSLGPVRSKLAVLDTFPPYSVYRVPRRQLARNAAGHRRRKRTSRRQRSTGGAERGYRAPGIVDDADEIVIGTIIRIRVWNGRRERAARAGSDDDVARRNPMRLGQGTAFAEPPASAAVLAIAPVIR